MDRPKIMRLVLVGTFLSVVAADAPLGLYPPSIPARIYGPPRVELPTPIPAPTYGVPRIELPQLKPIISTSYRYEVIHAPKPVEILTPYPAHILKSVPTPLYGLPKTEILKPIVPVASSYSYHIAHEPIKLLKTYAAPAPVYGPPRIEPAIPAPIYGVPKIEIPAKPVLTSYDYSLPLIKRIELVAPKLAPYAPAAAIPIAPHSRYGLPLH